MEDWGPLEWVSLGYGLVFVLAVVYLGREMFCSKTRDDIDRHGN